MNSPWTTTFAVGSYRDAPKRKVFLVLGALRASMHVSVGD